MYSPALPDDWYVTNQNYLMAAIARVRRALQRQPEDGASSTPSPSPMAALDTLCHVFKLSPFERDVLLLCAGMEFDSSWGTLCATAQGDPQCRYPTLGLALLVLPNPLWGALAPSAPLRRWRLVEIGNGTALTTSPLRIDERILNQLAGIHHLDDRLMGLLHPVNTNPFPLVPSHQQWVSHIETIWVQSAQQEAPIAQLPIVQLCGDDQNSQQAIAATVCHTLGLQLHTLAADTLPTDTHQLHLLKCLCEREYVLLNLALLIEWSDRLDTDSARESMVNRFIEQVQCPVFVVRRDRRHSRKRPQLTIDISLPTPEEQRSLWQTLLGDRTVRLNGQIDRLLAHFNLTPSAIHNVCLELDSWDTEALPNSSAQRSVSTATDGLTQPAKLSTRLWNLCRSYARPRLDELAQRIDGKATWDDLILPDKEKQVLREIAAHVHQRVQVYQHWGFGAKSDRGLGISALFAGASGTGKTLAAEVVAEHLQLDVYRIDLSSIVSKYIGETEKNLRRVFDAAEGSGVILLFDEADALFGKRSEVKDSHDRYANMEVSYLLQRMESYRGLAILTTNLKGSIDQAFLRRIRFIVQFPFPDATQRAEIWRHVFPRQTPTEGLDFEKLAKLSVAGGNIRNIAMSAAFLAAEAGEPVMMKHLLQAAKSEYVKLERPLTDAEVKGWV